MFDKPHYKPGERGVLMMKLLNAHESRSFDRVAFLPHRSFVVNFIEAPTHAPDFEIIALPDALAPGQMTEVEVPFHVPADTSPTWYTVNEDSDLRAGSFFKLLVAFVCVGASVKKALSTSKRVNQLEFRIQIRPSAAIAQHPAVQKLIQQPALARKKNVREPASENNDEGATQCSP